MDAQRFDLLTRALTTTRRKALHRAIGFPALAALLGGLSQRPLTAAAQATSGECCIFLEADPFGDDPFEDTHTVRARVCGTRCPGNWTSIPVSDCTLCPPYPLDGSGN